MAKLLVVLFLWAVLPLQQVDVQSFTELHRFEVSSLGEVAFSPNEALLAVGTSSGVELYDTSGDELVRMSEHYPDGASRIEWSPDGNWLAIEDSWLLGDIPPRTYTSLTLWNVRSGETRSLPLETPYVKGFEFSPDSSLLAVTAYHEGAQVYVYEVASGQQLHNLIDPGMEAAYLFQTFDAAFSPDSSQLATNGDAIIIWDMTTGAEQQRWAVESPPVLMWSDAGLMTNWGTITLWDVETGAALNTANGDYNRDFSDGVHVILERTESHVAMLDLPLNAEGYTIETAGQANATFFENLLLVTVGQTLQIYDGDLVLAETTLPTEEIEASELFYRLMDVAPDGRWLAFRIGSGLDELLIWNLETDTAEGEFPAFMKRLVGVRWFEEDYLWITGTSDAHEFISYSMILPSGEIDSVSGAIGEWGGEALDPLIVTTLDSSDFMHTIIIDIHGMIRVYVNGEPGTPMMEIQTEFAYSADLSPDGRYLASGGTDVRIWDAETGELVTVLDGHQGAVTGVSWWMEGTKLASVDSDGIVVVWGMPE